MGTKYLSLVIMPIVLLILDAMLSMWYFHVRLPSTITPKYFINSLHSILLSVIDLKRGVFHKKLP